MTIKEGNTLYVRIDYKDGHEIEAEQDALDSVAYLEKLSKERYLLAGMFGGVTMENIAQATVAMIIFEAENYGEAEKIAKADPIIARSFYAYTLREWNVQLTSK